MCDMNTTPARESTVMQKSVDTVGRLMIKKTDTMELSRAELYRRDITGEQVASFNNPRDLRHAAKACGNDRDRVEHPAPAKHRGAWSEIMAMSWLIEQGYEVFRNISATGFADLVAHNFNTGKTWLVDVKTCTIYCNKDGTYYVTGSKLSAEQTSLGVRPLYVTHDGIVEWDRRLIAAAYEKMQPIVRVRVKTDNHKSTKL